MTVATLFVVGPAGSGKSSLCGALKHYLELSSKSHALVNLDPGAEILPYTPDIDVREWISMEEVMDRYGLGPNGAQIVANDMIANYTDEIKEELENLGGDIIIYDTAGQIELFAFRAASEFIFRELSYGRGMLLFTFDPVLAKTPSGFVTLLMLSSAVHFRFQAPFINALTKIDILEDDDLANIAAWSQDSNALYNDLLSERPSMVKELNIELFRALENAGAFRGVIATSAKNLYGMDEIYAQLLLNFTAGEEIE